MSLELIVGQTRCLGKIWQIGGHNRGTYAHRKLKTKILTTLGLKAAMPRRQILTGTWPEPNSFKLA